MKILRHQWHNLLALGLCLVLSAGCSKESKARRLLADADRDFKAEKYDTAEIEYQSVLRLTPLNPAAVRQLGFIYFEEGRTVPLAFKFLQKANQLEPNNAEIQLKLADIYASNKKPKEAADLLTKVLQADPANDHALLLLVELTDTNKLPALTQRLETQLREGGQSEAACHSALGWIDLRLQNTNAAEAELQKATTLDPKLPSPYLGRAALCSMQHDVKGAEAALKKAADLSPIRSSTRLKYVDYKMRNGAVEEATAELRKMTDKAPDYIPAWLYLMRVYFAEHKFDESKEMAQRILARENYNFDAMLQLGTLALAQRDVPLALSTLRRMDDIYKNVPVLKYHLAFAHLLNNEKQKAIADLNDALALDRNYDGAALLLAELYYRSGNMTESVNLLLQLIKRHPDNLQAEMALADTYLGQDQPLRALEVYDRVTQMFPKNADVPRLAGAVLEKEGDLTQARAAFEKSLALAPDNLATLQQITALDVYEKHFAEAHRRITNLLEKTPKVEGLWLLQGAIFQSEGQTNQAESAYVKAVELSPDSPNGYLKLALFYQFSHQSEKALARLNALLAKTNDLSARMMIGVIHQTAGHYEEAARAYQKILDTDPKNVSALNNLAYLDSEFMGKLSDGLKLAETARQLRPYDMNTADTLGWILYRNRDYARALSLIQESAEKQPDDAEVQMHLGMAYYMMEEEKPARVALQKAVASTADFPDKQLARRRLEALDIDPSNATPAMVEKLKALVHDDPQDPVPLSRLASIQMQNGDVQAAAASLEKLLLLNPQDWPAMVRLARLDADRLNQPRKALDLAKSAHALAPTDGEAGALLGELAYRSEDYPWALSLLEEAAASSSAAQPMLSYYLGLSYYAMGRMNDADAAMQKAVQQGLSQPYLDQAKQFMAFRAAANDPAQAQASAALAHQILDKEPRYVPALMVMAAAAKSQNALDEARQSWEKVLSIYPQFAPAMRELALLFSHSQSSSDLDKAFGLAEKARAAMPDDSELAKTLGILAYGRGDYRRSQTLLQGIANKSGNDAEVPYYLGMDYYKLQQPKQCKEALLRAIDLHVSGDLAAKAQGILSQMK